MILDYDEAVEEAEDYDDEAVEVAYSMPDGAAPAPRAGAKTVANGPRSSKVAIRSYFPETWLWDLHDMGCVIETTTVLSLISAPGAFEIEIKSLPLFVSFLYLFS